MTSRGRLAIAIAVIGGLACAGLPLILAGEPYLMRLVTMFSLLLVLAASWNIVGGFTGYPSFATGAFFGFGAYVAAILQAKGVDWRLAMVAAGLAGGVLAAPVGYGVLRLRGHYFAVASLMLGTILKELTTGWSGLTGGGMGLTITGAGGDPEVLASFALRISLALAVLTVLLGAAIKWSRLGFGLDCIRMNETAAAGIGVDAQKLKTYAFILSSVPSAVAGAVYAGWIGYIDPTDVYDVIWSVKPIVAVLLGGVGTILGPVVGAAIFVALEEIVWRNVLSFSAGGLGVLIVLLLLVLPAGVLPSLVSSKTRP
ncbi:branched-chain amino acid transport system permease protein [Bradyrhizobium sp. S3.2.6]|uniref:branched-chain amino acid ABC transporter permease n=1 Tax=Bradyrhizobium sp. S3.2.6 TaxID=3156428 RepID=UPI003390C630